MTLETVVRAILDRGKTEADLILEEAHIDRQRMLSELRAEGAKLLAESDARARQAIDRRRIQELSRGELEARKIVLAGQKDALDRVYQTTLERLRGLTENEAILRALLKANDEELRTGRVYANSKDEAVVRRIVGERYADRIDCVGGVVIEAEDGTRRVDLRYESILRDVWDDSVKEVAEILWPSKGSKS